MNEVKNIFETLDKKSTNEQPIVAVEVQNRNESLDKVTESINYLTTEVLSTWIKYIDQQSASKRLEADIEEKQHKRSVSVLVYVLTLFFILLIAALIKEQYELIKLLLTSGLAVSAGAGLSGLFKSKKENK